MTSEGSAAAKSPSTRLATVSVAEVSVMDVGERVENAVFESLA